MVSFSLRFAPIVSLLACIFLFAGCSGIRPSGRTGAYGDPVVRVAVASGKEIKVSGNPASFSGKWGNAASFRGEVIISPSGDGFFLNDKLVDARTLELKGNEIRVEGRAYRGKLTLIRERGKVVVINHIGLEHYLLGLINHEISSKWPADAVKAQAVAARSYAYRKIMKGNAVPYHLKSTVLDQVYGGTGKEDDRAAAAVNATRGEVIYYGGEVANALYHSSCGGTTASSAEVWKDRVSYLESASDPYCTDAPNYFWQFYTDFDELEGFAASRGIDTGGERSFRVSIRAMSGRAAMISFGRAEMTGNDFRAMIGYGRLKSTLFQVETDGERLSFTGSGSGHGVGMCQWGAKGMAEKGRSYRDILRFYYQGIRVRRAY